MKIKTSQDWQKVEIELFKAGKQAKSAQFLTLITNIAKMVSMLSKLEVDARRTKQFGKVNAKVAEINDAIDFFEVQLTIELLRR